MHKAPVNGCDIHYHQVGEGEDIIFVHGLAANHAFWNFRLLMPLAEHYRITAYDLRGHGYSGMPDSGYSSDVLAEDLIGLMDCLGIRNAHLVGHSYGGVVVMHCAARHPDRVLSLTIQDSRIRALQPHQRLRDWPNWRQAQAKLLEYGINIDENAEEIGVQLLEQFAKPEWRENRERLAQGPLFGPFSGWSAGKRSAQKWLKLLETTTARQDIQLEAGLNMEALKRIHQPTLAIYGQHSRCLKTYKRLNTVLPNCMTHLLPGVGHFYPLIKPVVVSELILAFLRSMEEHHNTAPERMLEARTASQGQAWQPLF
mgnify:CR=1 FL=1